MSESKETLEKWANTFIGQIVKPSSGSTVKEPSKVIRFTLGKRLTGATFYLENGGWAYKIYR